ncbi:MAG: hypothetical protein ACRDFS_07665 [Chloroflexota bacterium]
MTWDTYLAIWGRRWAIIAAILILDLLVSGALFYRSYHHTGYQASSTLYVADLGATGTSLQSTGQLLAGMTAADFLAEDVKDIATSQVVARYVAHSLAGRHLPDSSASDLNAAVGSSRVDRTVRLTVTSPSSATALAASRVLANALTSSRGRFMGTQMARRTLVKEISAPVATRVPANQQLTNLGLRLVLGVIVAFGAALAWDAVDPNVRDVADMEKILGVPVLAASR